MARRISAGGTRRRHVANGGIDAAVIVVIKTIQAGGPQDLNDGRVPDWQFPEVEQNTRQSLERLGTQLGRCAWKEGARVRRRAGKV